MRITREQRVHNLRVKLAFQYGVIGLLFGMLWSWGAQISANYIGTGWLGGMISGVVCFIVLGGVIMRLFSYLADGSTETLLDKSTEYSATEKILIGGILFYGFHGAIIGIVAYFILSFVVGSFHENNSVWLWYIGGGVLGAVPCIWYGWTEVE